MNDDDDPMRRIEQDGPEWKRLVSKGWIEINDPFVPGQKWLVDPEAPGLAGKRHGVDGDG